MRDLGAVLAESGPMVEPRKALSFFAQVFVQFGVRIWPERFDLDAIALYMAETGSLTLSRAA